MDNTIKSVALVVATIGGACAFINRFGKQNDEDNVKGPEKENDNKLTEAYRWNQFLRALNK